MMEGRREIPPIREPAGAEVPVIEDVFTSAGG